MDTVYIVLLVVALEAAVYFFVIKPSGTSSGGRSKPTPRKNKK